MRTDLLLRAVPPLAALVSLAAGGPVPLTGGLALAGLVLAVERLVSLRDRGPLDAVLVGVGALVTTLVLGGLVIDLVGVRLGTASWTVGLAAASLAGLVLAAALGHRTPRDPVAGRAADRTTATGRRTTLATLPWVALAGVVVVVAVSMTRAAITGSEVPPVAMALGEVDGTQVEVLVTSSGATGPLEVRTSDGENDTSYPLIEVPADGSTTTTVSLPTSGRYSVTLSNPGQTEPLRTLVVDR